MRLLDNDSAEAQTFLTKVKEINYISFNRHFLDIYKKLENQLDYLTMDTIYEYVNSYLEKHKYNNGIPNIIPTDLLLQDVINRLKTASEMSNVLQTDVIDKLSALQFTIESLSDLAKSSELYNDLELPSKSELTNMLKSSDSEFETDIINSTSSINKNVLQDLINAYEGTSPPQPIGGEKKQTKKTMKTMILVILVII
jgi:hypothetical protein